MSSNLDYIIDSMQEEIIKAVQESVKIDSIEGVPEVGMPFGKGPAEALQNALTLANNLGFTTKNIDNIIGYAEFGKGEEMVAVLGHLDVVAAGDCWTHPPFAGEIYDGILWGRGTIDNKGPTIGALFAMRAIAESGLEISRRIRVIFGTNEETGSRDAVRYNETEEAPTMGFTPDARYPIIFAEKGILTISISKKLDQRNGTVKLTSFIGGKTSNIVPDLASAIVLDCEGVEKKYTAKGIAAHGSTPEMGINAIITLLNQLKKIDFCHDLKQWISFILEKIGDQTDGKAIGIKMKDDKSGALTLNLGTMNMAATANSMGTNETFAEDEIEAKINIRYPVSKTFREIEEVINKTLSEAGIKVKVIVHKKPLYIPEDSELIRKLQKVYEKKTGNKAELIAIGGGTYAKSMNNTVAFGPIFPGQKDLTHQANECISIENLMKNVKIMAAAMYELAK